MLQRVRGEGNLLDQDVIELARQLQLRLQRIDPRADRATFEWAHGFLITLVEQIERSIPALTLKRISSSKSDLDEAERILKELRIKFGRLEEPDSLERIEKELEGLDPDDPAGVPAKRKPGPKGLSGGAALPLPE
jgi:hypothetical protein